MLRKKIKDYWIRYTHLVPVTIFSKIVLLYSSIVFLTLLIIAAVLLTGLHYSINTSAEQDVQKSAAQTMQYLDTTRTLDTAIFVRSDIPSYVTLQIYDSAGTLILDNAPPYSIKTRSDRTIDDTVRTNIPLPETIQGDTATGISCYRTWAAPDGKIYYLRFSHNPEKETKFFTRITKQLLALMLGGLLLTTVLGMYIMKKSMAPIHHMSAAMDDLEVSKLGKRIPLSNDKNELHELAVSINQALDRIEYGYTQQQQFISDASHELRTPITVIAGYTDLLDRWGKNDPAILDESLAAIKSETDYMKNLIERLLFFARSNRGSLKEHFLIFDTAQLLHEVYTEVTLINKEHSIQLGPNEPAMIYAEPGSIKQMLRIFIDNALKYTPAGGHIQLSCKKGEHTAAFTVADTGIGIPKEQQERVFERFYRVDSSRTKATGGSGLGLSIAKHIAKANHATIEMKSEEHKGTEITVIFSLDLPEENT